MKFQATIEIRIGNPYILVSAARATKLKPGWRKPLPVLIKINGQPEGSWPINMMPVGDGSFYLYLHGDVRNASNTTVGDTVTVEIHFNSEYKNGPQHRMPPWFSKALGKNPTAKTNWKNLPPSRKKEVLRYFSQLKSTEAKDRNLEKALAVLSGKTARFMARTWKNGI
ncbi:YdeI/OmpD-associated family protein [Bdellovibrio sp. HCB288]|uniref:YdeI/OmpD-associated family protein n=1 Tax=Bdellovibrio sp. HCB288 TaxID=3394355 RepID=UPI0039B641A7